MSQNPFVATVDETRDLVRSAIQTLDVQGRRLSVHVAEGDTAVSRLGLRTTAAVFEEAFDNSAELLHEEYGSLVPSMLHVVVVDLVGQQPIASLGFSRGQAKSLKSLVDVANGPWQIPTADSLAFLGLSPQSQSGWDLTTLAVTRPYRRSLVGLTMIHSAVLLSLKAELTAWTAILDDPLLTSLDRLARGFLTPLNGATSRPYLGSAGSTPICVRFPATDVALKSWEPLSTGNDPAIVFDEHLTSLRDHYRALQPELELVGQSLT